MRRSCALGLVVVLLAAGFVRAGTSVRILFMHHSTGANLLRDGGVREGLSALGYEFWDHGYNDEGLNDARGEPTGVSYAVPDDNTDPDGWAAIFSQAVTAPPVNTLSRMLEYDVILFKSCFPASNITDDEMLANDKRYYLRIREAVDGYPDRLFIAFTPPPLVPGATDPASAARAREWAAYLVSDEFLGGRRNFATFDLFSLLADADGILRQEYRGDEGDSHPNELANRTVGPKLVEFVRQAVGAWQAAG